jgi:hypothetical protein
MSVLFATHVPEPVRVTARATAMSSDSQDTEGELIAFRVASRITQVPSGAQYSPDTLRITITRAQRRMEWRYSQTASLAE